MTGNLNMQGNTINMNNGRITNLPEPTGPQQPATRQYVDTQIASNSLSTPPSCSGSNRALGWSNGRWVCNTIQTSTGSGGGGGSIWGGGSGGSCQISDHRIWRTSRTGPYERFASCSAGCQQIGTIWTTPRTTNTIWVNWQCQCCN